MGKSIIVIMISEMDNDYRTGLIFLFQSCKKRLISTHTSTNILLVFSTTVNNALNQLENSPLAESWTLEFLSPTQTIHQGKAHVGIYCIDVNQY